MRFLAFADSHASFYGTKEIVKLASQVDMVICAGDFTDFGNFADTLLQQMEILDKILWFVTGNHEDENPKLLEQISQNYPWVKNLEGIFVVKEEITFCGCSYRASERYARSPYSQELENLVKKIKNYHRSVFVTHCPPAECEVAFTKTGDDGGSSRIRAFVEKYQPELVLCGHIHRPLQRECRIGKSLIINISFLYQIFEL